MKSIAVMTAVVCVCTGCSLQHSVQGQDIAFSFVIDGYENVENSKSSVITDSSAETMISDCNIWIFDDCGNFLLHEFCSCKDSSLDAEKLFSVNNDIYHIYAVTNVGSNIDFTPEAENDMTSLKLEFDYGKFSSLGIPAAGHGPYAPGKGAAFHIKRLAAKYAISISDATAGGAKPYEFRFSGPDGKVVCRNLAKKIFPFADSTTMSEDVFGNDEDVEFLSREELVAIDSGEAVEKTLYLLENMGGGLSASYLEVCGNGRVDADVDGAEGKAGYCWDRVTCRYVFGSGSDGTGTVGVRRNTLNKLSLSVTNGILDHCDGWHVVADNLVFDGSMEFSPEAELGIRDNDAVLFQAVPKDRWGRNEDIEYTLNLPPSLSDLTVRYRKSSEEDWLPYVCGGSDSLLVGSNQFLLQNFSPDERKGFMERLVFRSSDGTAFSTLPLTVDNAKGKYLFQTDRGQGYQTLDRLVLSPDGLPFCGTVLSECEARFRGIRTPFCAEQFMVDGEEDGQSDWLWIESAARDGEKLACGTFDAMYEAEPAEGYRIFADKNQEETRTGTITASYPSYLGQPDTRIHVSQIGLQSSFKLLFDYYGTDLQALYDYRSGAERIWNEKYAAKHMSMNWNSPSEYKYCGDHINFGIKMDMKAKLKVSGYDGAVDINVSYIVKTEISRHGDGILYDFNFPYSIESREVSVSYSDAISVRKWPLTKEAYLEITDFRMSRYMDKEDIIETDCDEEGLFYLNYLDECLKTINNRNVSLHYCHNGVYVPDYLTFGPHTDFSLKPRLDLNTIYNLYGDGISYIYLEL